MKQSVTLPYGRITYGSLGKTELLNKNESHLNDPNLATDWISYTKEVFREFYPDRKYAVYSLQQVHGDEIKETNIITELSPISNEKEGDGLFTLKEKEILVVRTADCVPVFLYSTKQPFVSVLHSGWKGTKLGITEKMIQSLLSWGFSIEELEIVLGPYIQKSRYEVGEDVARFFLDLGTEVCSPKEDGKYLLDVGQAIERRVKLKFGEEISIHNERIDVFQTPQFFSHRAKEEGRNLNFILWEFL